RRRGHAVRRREQSRRPGDVRAPRVQDHPPRPRLPRHDRTSGARTPMTTTDASLDELPRWSVADLHESLESRSFLASMEQAGAAADAIAAPFDPLAGRARAP